MIGTHCQSPSDFGKLLILKTWTLAGFSSAQGQRHDGIAGGR